MPKTAGGKIRRHGLAAALVLDDAPGLGAQPAVATTADDDDRPPSPLEAKLQKIWAASLGCERVGLHDDYFDLGGDSLQAVELFLQVEEALDRRLPRSVLVEAGTVAEMARHIEYGSPPSCLVLLQPKGDRAPFFCVHDVTGDVVSLLRLARHVGEDRPFYGVRSVGPDGADGGAGQLADMEAMAAYYVGEIRKLQPAGPYFLGGHSFGGKVAFEMAQQLLAAGEEVALLALIDTFSDVGSRYVAMPQRLARHRRALAGLPLRDRPDYVLRRVRKIAGRAGRSLSRRMLAVTGGVKRRSVWSSNLRVALEAISSAYQPKPYRGDAVLFKADLVAGRHTDSHDGWQGLIEGDLQIMPITGGHMEILFEPHVRGLASKLAECLRE